MSLEYKIYSGAGNILAVIEGNLSKEQIVHFCSQHSLDGILCLSYCSSADVFMRVFNSDGSEAEMCGNGLRIVIKHLFFKIKKISYNIATLSGIYRGYINNGRVVVNMAKSSWDFRRNIYLTYKNKSYVCHFINTGVPHAVIFTNVENLDVQSLGSAIRFSETFAPEGVNVDFVSISRDSQAVLFVRTYERGVEKETGACGTGATAAALVASEIYNLSSPIKVITSSQECLNISFDSLWKEVMIEGEVRLIEEGVSYLLDESQSIDSTQLSETGSLFSLPNV